MTDDPTVNGMNDRQRLAFARVDYALDTYGGESDEYRKAWTELETAVRDHS